MASRDGSDLPKVVTMTAYPDADRQDPLKVSFRLTNRGFKGFVIRSWWLQTRLVMAGALSMYYGLGAFLLKKSQISSRCCCLIVPVSLLGPQRRPGCVARVV